MGWDTHNCGPTQNAVRTMQKRSQMVGTGKDAENLAFATEVQHVDTEVSDLSENSLRRSCCDIFLSKSSGSAFCGRVCLSMSALR